MHFNSFIKLVFILYMLSQETLTLEINDDAVLDLGSSRPEGNPQRLRLWLTISARKRFLEISWKNAPALPDDRILLTSREPRSFERLELVTGTPLAKFDGEGSGSEEVVIPADGFTSTQRILRGMGIMDDLEPSEGSGQAVASTTPQYWISNNGVNDIVAAIVPTQRNEWFTTGVPFDYAISQNINKNTTCYGYWASYINGKGDILAGTCVRAYARWMHDMRSVIGSFRIRDLFIPGTHDSGSYKSNFDPLLNETLVTKYALTQDEDIRGQLMHGARYLDIRVGYYRNAPEKFYIHHGITRQRPLIEVIEQVKEFVLDTNEIVIFGLKEFPVGFGKKLGVHRLLVSYLSEQFGDLIVHPSATWSASLRDIWSRHQNVILAYDKGAVVREFPHTLFGSVEQRWGNVQNWDGLDRYLRQINSFDPSRLSSRPVADMAELTPDTWGVILDRHGGLRRMADNVNWRISQMYRDELGEHANIVAVDFMRGTTLMETAIDWNKRKVID